MSRAKKPPLLDLNEHLICKLCKGYFVDATTVIECLHTFCRSCIVKYLETTKYCPICDVQVHKSKPLLSLRSDKIIQDTVYKLVPRLYQNELRRRKDFQKKHPGVKLSASEESFEASQSLFLSPEEELCVTLTYYGSLGKPRYLRCPSAVSVMVLQKLIRAKFGLSDSHHVDILHNQDCLSPCYTLMDIMFIYKLSKLEPLDLTYRIYEYMAKKLKLENQECKTETDISQEPPVSNNNNWKEVQLRISENGEMSITGIQDDITSQNFSKEMIEVLDSKPKSPVMNAVKKKEIPNLKIVRKPTQGSKCINIISDTLIRPYTPDSGSTMNPVKDLCKVLSSVSIPSINSSTTTVFTTVNSTKCSVAPAEAKEETEVETIDTNADNETTNKKVNNLKEPTEVKEAIVPKGIKRKSDDSNNVDSKAKTKKIDSTTPVNENKSTTEKEKINEEVTNKEEIKPNENNKTNSAEIKDKVQIDVERNNSKPLPPVEHHPAVNGSSEPKHKEETEKCLISLNPTPPKPSTKYQGASQPCYMPKTSFNPVLNIPKLHQSGLIAKSEPKTTTKMASSVKNDVKANASPSSGALNNTSNTNSIVKQKLNTKVKSNAPMGYKTLKDPPKSWNSQISKANLNKAQPDQKYSDLKNVRPAKFFKMRNNMLRFLGNPASGVKPMYSVHANSEQDKLQEKAAEAKEVKKQSIVKIDPKTLKPITDKAPETPIIPSQGSTTGDLKINTSSVSIFNPLKLQSNSPKSERKSPKSPQSPRHKSSPSPSPPVVPKRDKPNLNFTPPNPFVPNLSSQTVNPNQFLCGAAAAGAMPPGFPSYDPRVMAAYHNLFYGAAAAGMGFAPGPMAYHLGGLDIAAAQRGGVKGGFDISKLVGMQQQQASSSKSPQSPQSTSKLDVPIVPPQVPYQPRPSPMTSRASNMTSTSKRPHKDLSKNEKSLQNTVEKLTLSRAKEINRAAEALNKLSSLDVTKIDNNRQSKLDSRKEEARESKYVSDNRQNDAPKKPNTSQEQAAWKKEDQTVKSENTQDKVGSDKNAQASEQKLNELKCPNIDEKPSKTDEEKPSENTKTTSSKTDNSDIDVTKNINSKSNENESEKSDNVKKVDGSVKEESNKAGSENMDGLAGNK